MALPIGTQALGLIIAMTKMAAWLLSTCPKKPGYLSNGTQEVIASGYGGPGIMSGWLGGDGKALLLNGLRDFNERIKKGLVFPMQNGQDEADRAAALLEQAQEQAGCRVLPEARFYIK